MKYIIDNVEYDFYLFFTKTGRGISSPNKYYKSDKCDYILIEVIRDSTSFISIIDSSSFDIVSVCNWKISNDTHTKYLKNSNYGVIHRSIMNVSDMNWKDVVVDHKNGNGLDNRIENLRLLTMGESLRSMHQKGYSKTADGRFRVMWNEEGKVKSKSFRISKFDSEEEAENEAIKYRKYVEKYIYKNGKYDDDNTI